MAKKRPYTHRRRHRQHPLPPRLVKLKALLEAGPHTRTQLAEKLGLRPETHKDPLKLVDVRLSELARLYPIDQQYAYGESTYQIFPENSPSAT